MVKIYTLSCPFTNQIKYVGKTVKKNLKLRLGEHLQECKRNKGGLKNNWVKSLIKLNEKPIIELICEIEDDKDWQSEEIFYISYLRFLGFDLKNLTEGGEGTRYKMTQEHKDKISATHKKKEVTE